MGNITLIRELSEGIVNRCEHQIKVYESNQNSLEQWFNTISVIQTELIRRFYLVFNFEQYSSLMHTGLLLLQLKKEVRNLQNGHNSSIMKKMIESVSNEEKTLEQLLVEKIDMLQDLLHEYLHSSTLNDELKRYIRHQVECS